jgi:hypothetical protein
MYAIGHIIYGVPLTEKISKKINKWENQEPEDDEPEGVESPWFEDDDGVCGFTTMYSGSGDYTPGYCGVELLEFDECEELFLGDETFQMKPTSKQKASALKRIEKLHPDLKKLLPKVGLYIVWSSS